MCLAYYVVRARFDTNFKREAFSRNVNRLRELFHAVHMMFTKSYHLLSHMLRVKFLVLISASSYARI